MKRYLLAGTCLAAGFAMAQFLPPAFGAENVQAAYRQLDLFGAAFERVRANYVRETDDAELISAAIEGMVTSLDPHSSYMDPKDYQSMQTETKAEYGGLGLEVSSEDGLIKVVSPIDDTPASRAGLQSGDYISAIDGISIQGLPLDQAVERMKGPENSQVTLTVMRSGEKAAFDVTLTRAVIRTSSVKWSRKGDIGYIRISTFMNERTAQSLEQGVRELKRDIGPGIKGYVLDLRDDPGGLVDQAVAVVDDFVNGGEIVSTRGRNPEDTERYNAKQGDITDGKPIIVLINEGSASASEIVAGALQDHRRATVIGVPSFGKGSMQTIMPLNGGRGGALSLTTARYYTPSGRSIQATGISPDIAVSNLTVQDQVLRDQFALRSEAELPGHLEQEGAHRDLSMPFIRPEAGAKFDDFQLSYALDRLNGKVVSTAAVVPDTALR